MISYMPTARTPKILFVDDTIEEVSALSEACEQDAIVVVRSFDELDEADLENTDLILVDFALDGWPAKDRATELTLRPADGLAIVEILRSYFRANKSERPIAFAVLSGELEKLTHPFPPTRREHMVASLAKVEWAFQKGTPLLQTAKQLLSLASAVRELPPSWPHDSNSDKDKTLHDLLAVPDSNWSTAAVGDLSRCHPPIQELSTWSHGLAFLRWMLQRVLPYPTFLLDDAQAALRLGLTFESFCASLTDEGDLNDWLKPVCYSGILTNFRGRRWWKAGIDSLLWTASSEDPFNSKLLAAEVLKKAPKGELLVQRNPVAYVDKDYQTIGIDEASNCIRLRPDDWPLFADSAWALRASVLEDQSLLMAVEDVLDRETLGAERA